MNNCPTSFGCRNDKDKVGVILAQLGTPDAPTASALRRYLKQFLSDRRVIEVNRVLWWFILNGIILNTRPKRSAKLYKRIWTDAGSPLLLITQKQRELLEGKLKAKNPNIEVGFGMRIGSPSIESCLDDLIAKGCHRLVLVPMYPQYAAATIASTFDAVYAHLLKLRWVPSIRTVEPFYYHSAYLKALSTTINEGLKKFSPERLIISYHGIPQSSVRKGDPYCCMCTETTARLKPLLEFPATHIMQTYQSRFGKEAWLQPYTDETLEKLAKSGIKKVAVACPSFTADCLETLDEIGNESAHLFKKHGGQELKLIPSVNDDALFIDALYELTLGAMGNWDVKGESAEDAKRINCLALSS